MLIGKTIERYKATEFVTYEMVQIDLVGMGAKRVHSYSIYKKTNNNKEYVARKIKNENAAFMIWEDIKAGIQK